MWVNKAEANGIDGVDDDCNGYIDDIYGIDSGDNDSDLTRAMGLTWQKLHHLLFLRFYT